MILTRGIGGAFEPKRAMWGVIVAHRSTGGHGGAAHRWVVSMTAKGFGHETIMP